LFFFLLNSSRDIWNFRNYRLFRSLIYFLFQCWFKFFFFLNSCWKIWNFIFYFIFLFFFFLHSCRDFGLIIFFLFILCNCFVDNRSLFLIRFILISFRNLRNLFFFLFFDFRDNYLLFSFIFFLIYLNINRILIKISFFLWRFWLWIILKSLFSICLFFHGWHSLIFSII
jgi:hypothetical protein